ncbi:MAG: hypothetical protein QHH24_03255 [Candidatus Bathyarchaeota archaeon]|nr:hypothetical protein [Candidatus Bathyarchaeota archaeon]
MFGIDLKFDVRYFCISLILALFATFISYLPVLSMLLRLWKPTGDLWYYLALQPLAILVSVFLTFGVMYAVSRDVEPPSMYWSAVYSTFFGCWLGNIVILVSTYILSILEGSTTNWYPALYICLQLVLSAFSLVFFVSFSAIMLAYYRKTLKPPPSVPSP